MYFLCDSDLKWSVFLLPQQGDIFNFTDVRLQKVGGFEGLEWGGGLSGLRIL